MKLAIVGQQDFGKAVLESFLARGDEVAAVFCAPEKEGARPDALRLAAQEKGLKVHQFKSLRAPEAAQAMRSDNIDFAVLWTTRAEFYRRAGWIPADCGVLGHCRGEQYATEAPGEARALWPAIHSSRESHGGERVKRTLANYAMLPPPATEHDAALEDGAYALIGRLGTTAYLYEIGGQPRGLPVLWHGLRQRYRELFINVRRGTAHQQWLSAQPGITWQDQNLAMWLALSGNADAKHFSDWYIPFLDRI